MKEKKNGDVNKFGLYNFILYLEKKSDFCRRAFSKRRFELKNFTIAYAHVYVPAL